MQEKCDCGSVFVSIADCYELLDLSMVISYKILHSFGFKAEWRYERKMLPKKSVLNFLFIPTLQLLTRNLMRLFPYMDITCEGVPVSTTKQLSSEYQVGVRVSKRHTKMPQYSAPLWFSLIIVEYICIQSELTL